MLTTFKSVHSVYSYMALMSRVSCMTLRDQCRAQCAAAGRKLINKNEAWPQGSQRSGSVKLNADTQPTSSPIWRLITATSTLQSNPTAGSSLGTP